MTDEPPPPESATRIRTALELVVGREGRVGSTVYGTVLVLATLTAAYAAERHNPRSLVELVITVVVVFWVAYVYAHALSDSIETGERLSRSGIGAVASRELGLVLAAVVPVLALVAGGIGLVHERASVWIAIALGLLILSAEGYRYARVTKLGKAGTAGILAANLMLGLSVVVMKVALVH